MPNELVYGTLSRSLPQVCPVSPLSHASYIIACNTDNVPLVHCPMLPTLWHVIRQYPISPLSHASYIMAYNTAMSH